MSHSFTRGTSISFTYLGLTDAPGSFVGDALKILRVNAGENAIEHVALTTSIVTEGSNLYFTDERVDDRVSSLIQNGTGISWSYNDGLNTLTPTISLASFSTTNLAEGANLYFTTERAQDAIGLNWSDTTTIDFTYNDPGGTFSADVIDNSSIQKIEVTKNSGAVVGTRKQLNFIEGTGIALTIADDVGNDQIDITIDSTAVSAHVLLDSTVHTDTTTGTVARGDLITGQTATPKWTRLAKGTANQIFQSDGTDIGWVSISGDIGLVAGVATIPNDTVTFAKFQNITDNRLLGRSAGSTGDMMEITVGTGLSLSAGNLVSTITQYTDELAQDSVGLILLDSASINFTYDDATPNITAVVTPAGSDTHVQFNDGGVLGADADFTWNKTTNTLTVGAGATGVALVKQYVQTAYILTTDANYNIIYSDAYPAGIQESVILGYGAFANASGNSQGVGIGHYAGGNLRGLSIIAIGYSAGMPNSPVTATGTVVIGDFSGARLGGGLYNTGVGHYSMAGNNSGTVLIGDYNSSFGYEAGRYMGNDANYNVAIGWQAGFQLGYLNDDNIAIGTKALATEGQSNGAAQRNIAIGGYSLHLQDGGGGHNVAIGWESGYNNIGEANVFIGYQSGKAETTTDNTLIIANNDTTNLIVGNFATGNVLIQRSIGLTLGSDAEGDIYFRDASGLLDRIAAHATPGYVLTSNGAAAAPSYQAVTAGSIGGGAALTKVDDTNVTLTLGGSPTTALLAATSLTLGWTGLLSLARGGTNKNLTPAAGAVVWTDADSMEVSAAGTTGQALISGGTGSPTWFAPTAGSVIFAGTGGILQQDNTNFFWDDSNNRLGLGNMIAGAPSAALQVRDSNSETRISITNDVGPATGVATLSIHNWNSGTGTAFVNFLNYGSGVGGNVIGSIPYSRLFYLLAGTSMDNFLINASDGNFILATTDTERFRVSTTGNVTWTLGSDATGDMWYRNSSGYMTRIVPGSLGDVLTMGASSVPAWAAPSGGPGGGALTYRDSTPDNGTYGLLAGSVNSSNTTFTVSEGQYETGSLLVWKNGQLMTQGATADWEETTPASGTFDFVTAPTTGDVITVEYAISAGGTPSPLYSVSEIDFADTPFAVTATSGKHIILVDATGGNVDVDLPTAVGNECEFVVKKIDSSANVVNVNADGVETIDDGATATLTAQYESINLITNNANWWIN